MMRLQQGNKNKLSATIGILLPNFPQIFHYPSLLIVEHQFFTFHLTLIIKNQIKPSTNLIANTRDLLVVQKVKLFIFLTTNSSKLIQLAKVSQLKQRMSFAQFSQVSIVKRNAAMLSNFLMITVDLNNLSLESQDTTFKKMKLSTISI